MIYIGVIPGWGDAIALICVVPFVYFSARVIKSIPLTLAVLNNALRDVLLGMAAHILWQLSVLSADIHCLTEFKILAAMFI